MKEISFRWEITYNCNLKCKHCFNRSGKNRKKDDLSLEQCILIVDKIIAFQQRHKDIKVNLGFSGGECFIYKHLPFILDYMFQNSLSLSGFMTNSLLLSKKMIDSFIEKRQKPFLVISFDSDFIRGKNFQKNAIKKINLCLDNNMNVAIKTTISQEDLLHDEPFKIYEQFKNKNIISLIYNPVNTMGRWQDIGMTDPDPDLYLQKMFELKDIYTKNNDKYSLIIDPVISYNHDKSISLVKTDIEQATGGCKESVIYQNGDVIKCLKSYYEQEKTFNIFTDDFEKYDDMLLSGCKYPYTCMNDNAILADNPECKECQYFPYCKAGMGLSRRHYANKKDIMTCKFFKDGYFDQLLDKGLNVSSN